jgi:hypothetical protein
MWYDLAGQLYNNHNPLRDVLSSSGGINNYAVSSPRSTIDRIRARSRTAARVDVRRLNLDQTIGDKFTVSGSVNFSHNLTQRRYRHTRQRRYQPDYTFGYAPAIYDLRRRSAYRTSRVHVDERRRHGNR